MRYHQCSNPKFSVWHHANNEDKKRQANRHNPTMCLKCAQMGGNKSIRSLKGYTSYRHPPGGNRFKTVATQAIQYRPKVSVVLGFRTGTLCNHKKTEMEEKTELELRPGLRLKGKSKRKSTLPKLKTDGAGKLLFCTTIFSFGLSHSYISDWNIFRFWCGTLGGGWTPCKEYWKSTIQAQTLVPFCRTTQMCVCAWGCRGQDHFSWFLPIKVLHRGQNSLTPPQVYRTLCFHHILWQPYVGTTAALQL